MLVPGAPRLGCLAIDWGAGRRVLTLRCLLGRDRNDAAWLHACTVVDFGVGALRGGTGDGVKVCASQASVTRGSWNVGLRVHFRRRVCSTPSPFAAML
jgi:hypothetical protein